MDNRVIEGRKMYHLDEKQIQEITDLCQHRRR